MSKKSLINKKALRYIIANSNLCKHAIREEVSGFITSWLSFGNRKAIIGAAEMRKCLDKIFDLAIDERLK